MANWSPWFAKIAGPTPAASTGPPGGRQAYMSYVLVGILLLLIASAFVAYLVMNASTRSGKGADATSADRDDAGAPGIGADESPLGDTTEHAGTASSAGGETVGEQDADRAGGTGGPVLSGDTDNPSGGPQPPSPDRRFQRDPVGGEAEARPFTES